MTSQSQPGQRRTQVSGAVNRRVGQTRWGTAFPRPARRRRPWFGGSRLQRPGPQPPALAPTLIPESSGAVALAASQREAPLGTDRRRRRRAAERQHDQHMAPPSSRMPPRELDLQIPGSEWCTEAWGSLCGGLGKGRRHMRCCMRCGCWPVPCPPPAPCLVRPTRLQAPGRQSCDQERRQTEGNVQAPATCPARALQGAACQARLAHSAGSSAPGWAVRQGGRRERLQPASLMCVSSCLAWYQQAGAWCEDLG